MSEKKVVRRSVAISLGIVCIVAIIFIAALSVVFNSYVESHHHTDDEYNSLQSQVYELNKTAGQVTLKPSDDTYVDSENPNSNYGYQTNLVIFHLIEEKRV
jgi:predicted PurR-regulated permease PerM